MRHQCQIPPPPPSEKDIIDVHIFVINTCALSLMDKTVIQHIENYTTPQLHCHIFPLIPLQGEAEEGEGRGGEEGDERGGGERRILTQCSTFHTLDH